jgi:hypothetical protein
LGKKYSQTGNTARPQSYNFYIHIFVSNLYIYTLGLHIWLQQYIYVDRSREYINRSQMYDYGDWEQGRAVDFWDYIIRIFFAVHEDSTGFIELLAEQFRFYIVNIHMYL